MNPIFNLYKIKYNKMNELLSTDIAPVFDPKNPVNVYISLDKIFKDLMKKPIDELVRSEMDDRKIFEPISNLLNLAAHYRNFFTKNRLYSRIILFGSSPDRYDNLINRLFCPDYRKNLEGTFHHPDHLYIKNLICECIPFAKTITEYIEDVYLVITNDVEPSIIPRLLMDNITDGVNILITKDPYEYQYVNYDFTILRPKKEKSYLINKDNLLDVLKKEHECLNSNMVHHSFYPFMLSLLGDKFRNIPKIKKVGLSTIINTICDAQSKDLIGKQDVNLSLLSTIINPAYINRVDNNFSVIELETQVRTTVGVRSYDILQQISNKFDNQSLRLINDRYFIEYPIYLLELTEAINIKRKNVKNLENKKKKNLFSI